MTLQTHLERLHQRVLMLWPQEEQKDTFWMLAGRSVMILLLFFLLEKGLLGFGLLALEDYHEPVIYGMFLKRLVTSWFGIPILLAAAGLWIFRRRLLSPWSVFPYTRPIRIFATMNACLLAWYFATYDFNLLFGQSHLVDRLLLIALAVSVSWRPIMIFPFLTVFIPVIGQMTLLPGFSWAIPFLPFRILLLINVSLFLFFLTGKSRSGDLIFLLGCLIGTFYWVAGAGKLNWEWIQHDHIQYLLPATYANGWLGDVDAGTIAEWTGRIGRFNVPMKVFTLLVECGPLFFFFHRRFPPLFFVSWVLFHAGVFAMSGIFFWMWILIHLCVLILLLSYRELRRIRVFTWKHQGLSILLIASGHIWSQPVQLAWFDVPVSYTYRFEAITEQGNTVFLPPRFFAPYDYQFTLGKFKYLESEPILPVTWGVTSDAGLLKWLLQFPSPGEIQERETSGISYGNAQKSVFFEQFIREFITGWNDRQSKRHTLAFLSAPSWLWTFPKSIPENQGRIVRVRVNRITSYYDRTSFREIRKVFLREIEILPAKPG